MIHDGMVRVVRLPSNPIISPRLWGDHVAAVFNPGVARVGNEVVMLARVEDRRGRSYLTVARTSDPEGIGPWHVDSLASLLPSSPDEEYGLEDPRVTRWEDGEVYLITYTAYSRRGPAVALARTRDFQVFERLGTVLPPEDKNAVLFPRKVMGFYAMLHRPARGGEKGIWISFSTDLVSWRDSMPVLMPVKGSWDEGWVGSGPPPIWTPLGWLLIYHGVRKVAGGVLYRAGFAVLDPNEPWRVVYRHPEWILGPEEPYERIGNAPNVVFPTGVLDLGNGLLRIYYGAADTVVAAADLDMHEVLRAALEPMGVRYTPSGCLRPCG